MDPPYPLMEEYDFRKDTKNNPLNIILNTTVKVGRQPAQALGQGPDNKC